MCTSPKFHWLLPMLASLACLCCPYLVGCCTHSCALRLEYPPGQLQQRLPGHAVSPYTSSGLAWMLLASLQGEGKQHPLWSQLHWEQFFWWPETTHSSFWVLLMVHLLHCPWFTSVAQPSLLRERILGRRMEKKNHSWALFAFDILL